MVRSLRWATVLWFRERLHRRSIRGAECTYLNGHLLGLLIRVLAPELLAGNLLQRDELLAHGTAHLGAKAVAG